MLPETAQQRASRLLAEDQAQRYGIRHPGKLHDAFCRCRACKPPYDRVRHDREHKRFVILMIAYFTFVVVAIGYAIGSVAL